MLTKVDGGRSLAKLLAVPVGIDGGGSRCGGGGGSRCGGGGGGGERVSNVARHVRDRSVRIGGMGDLQRPLHLAADGNVLVNVLRQLGSFVVVHPLKSGANAAKLKAAQAALFDRRNQGQWEPLEGRDVYPAFRTATASSKDNKGCKIKFRIRARLDGAGRRGWRWQRCWISNLVDALLAFDSAPAGAKSSALLLAHCRTLFWSLAFFGAFVPGAAEFVRGSVALPGIFPNRARIARSGWRLLHCQQSKKEQRGGGSGRGGMHGLEKEKKREGGGGESKEGRQMRPGPGGQGGGGAVR